MDGYYQQTPPEWLRSAAERSAGRAARELGLGPVKVLYWRAADLSKAWYGWAYPYAPAEGKELSINLNIDRLADEDDVISTCFHEVRHCWQGLTGRHLSDEQDALKWAYQMTGIIPKKRMIGE